MDQNVLRDFTKADAMSDVTIAVEGVHLYVHRQYLAEWSGVWRRMFLDHIDGEEPTDVVIELADKTLDEVKELLHCIYSTQKPISDHNVEFLLQFADEYDMPSMRMRCEDYLLHQDTTLERLVLAEKHNLKTLYKQGIEFAKTCTMEDLERSPVYKDISEATLIRIYKEKIYIMRDYANEMRQNEQRVQHRNDQLTAEKEGMLGVFQSIPKVWELPNKRCYKHVTEDGYDYTCRDCNEKVQREVRKMCHNGQHVQRFYKLNNGVKP